MAKMTERRYVQAQYQDDQALQTRRRLYERYATNPVPFSKWLFDQMDFPENTRVLELGCGNGALWQGRMEQLPPGLSLTLTDFSPGMVEVSRQSLGRYPFVSFAVADIAALPYPDASFDRVIANHMLYHVPDRPRALSQVRRVLRPGGLFYASTNGTGGMPAFLHQTLQALDPSLDLFGEAHLPFTLENGNAQLTQSFTQVQRRVYENAVEITDSRDLADYILSSTSVSDLPKETFSGLPAFLESLRLREGGVIRIPLKAGIFIAS